MIHAPKESRPFAGATLNYMYRGDDHEHSLVNFDGQTGVIHLGGNIFSADPIAYDDKGHRIVDISQIENEMETAAMNNRTAEKKFKHYVISIEKGRQLNSSQWLKVATEYVSALGFDLTNKWTACIHNDSDGECQHIHILASLVSCTPNRNLVSTSNDYAKGWPVMRKFEQEFKLEQLESPGSESDFGFNYTKNQIKGFGSRKECIENDWGAIIRARIKNLYQSNGKPKTIQEFALGLAKRNINMQAVKNRDSSIRGVNYQVLNFKKHGQIIDSPLISGSKVKATRFTWTKLQTKEGMNYNSLRDDPFIGLAPTLLRMTASIKVNKPQMRAIKVLGSRVKTKIHRSGYIDLSFCKTKQAKNIAMMTAAIMAILEALFSRDNIEFFEYTLCEYQNHTARYDLQNTNQNLIHQIKDDTQYELWKDLDDKQSSNLELEM